MGIGLSTEQLDLASAVSDWASGVSTASRLAAETDPAAVHVEAWKGAAGLGVFSIAVADHLGGDGGSMVDLATAVEGCAHALIAGSHLPTVIVGAVLSRSADPSPCVRELVARIASGAVVCALALGKPVAAESTSTGVVITGSSDLVLGAPDADVVLVAVEGGWFLVDIADTAVDRLDTLDPTRSVGRVRFDGVTVPAERRVHTSDDLVRDLAVTAAAAEAVGVSQWCTETAAAYARTRVQFGRPIGSFQAVKHLCAQMLCSTEQSVALAWNAARACDDGDRSTAVAAAAAVVFDNAVRAAKDCIQVLGGIGFTWEHDAHRYLRRATALRQMVGLTVPFGGTGSWARRCAMLTDHPSAPTEVRDVVDGANPEVVARARAGIRTVLDAPVDGRRDALVDTGLMMPSWPVPYGLAADAVAAVVIDTELEAAGVERPDLGIAAWTLPTIILHGTDSQRARFVPPTLRGEITWCQLFSEPEAGSDLASLRTTARRVDGGWRLDGQKVWTSNAQTAQWAVCLARTGVAGSRGITYFLVDMTHPGLTVRPLREITGDALFNEVFLNEVFVPDADVVGTVDGGWPLTRATLADERVSMGTSRAMGADAARVVDRWAGSPFRDDAVMTERIGHLVAVGMSVSLLGRRATLRRLHGRGPGAESSVQKLIGVEHRQTAADVGLDLLGPAGATQTRASSPEVYDYLLTRCLSIAGGSTQILRTVVGERLLGLPREPSARA